MNTSLHQGVVAAIERDDVPRFNLAMVQMRAERQAATARPAPRKRSVLLAVLLVGLPCLAAAAVVGESPTVQAINAELHRLGWGFIPTGVPVNVETAVADDPHRAVKTAAFHLVLPSALPSDAKLTDFEAVGTSGTKYNATYRLGNGGSAWFTLEKAIPNASYSLEQILMKSDRSGHIIKAIRYREHLWLVGDEVVSVASDALTPDQLSAVKRAMNGKDVQNIPRSFQVAP